jgi:CHAD domain-containing protein
MTRRHEQPHDEPFRETMRGVIAERLEAFLAAEAAFRARGDADAEVVHDARVASRRLRAALDVSTGALPRSRSKPLRGAVSKVAGALGEVRDADVQLAFLATQRDEVSARERRGVDRLIARVTRRREAASARALAALDDPRVRKALDGAAARLDAEVTTGGVR